MAEKVLMCWSGGKDSALALYEIKENPQYEVVSLLTTITESYDRISMHGVRRVLLERQAEAVGLPVYKIMLSDTSPIEEYNSKMEAALEHFKKQGVKLVAFGDIFLEDLRKWREDNLAKVGMKGVFPIWKMDTTELMKQFIKLGFKAITVCVNPKYLDKTWAGRYLDDEFLKMLPKNVDPCGENGEYHSYVFEGPIFRKPIPVTKGEVVERNPAVSDDHYKSSFYFCDLLPAD